MIALVSKIFWFQHWQNGEITATWTIMHSIGDNYITLGSTSGQKVTEILQTKAPAKQNPTCSHCKLYISPRERWRHAEVSKLNDEINETLLSREVEQFHFDLSVTLHMLFNLVPPLSISNVLYSSSSLPLCWLHQWLYNMPFCPCYSAYRKNPKSRNIKSHI